MRTLAAVIAAAALIAPAPAAGDGLPIGGLDVGPTGIEVPGTDARIVTLTAGRSTTIARVRRDGGSVAAWRFMRGRYTIPAVALDGSAGGMTRDGSETILIRPRAQFPQRTTRLAIAQTDTLRVIRRVELKGDFSFDALSPDGRTLYLIEYTSRRDPTRYLVRAYDLLAGRLRPDPIVDPRESPDDMRGFALTRTDSPDGRWAYTLYDGGGEHPFIHALDTVAARTVCIDLHPLEGWGVERLGALRLRAVDGGAGLEIHEAGRPLLTVDTGSFEVARYVRPAVAARPASDKERAGLVWPLTLGVASAGAAVAWLRRRRR